MDLSDFLFEKNIKIIKENIDKDGVLNEIASLAATDPSEQKNVFKKLKDREDLGSTGFGNGIAIPHCALDNIDEFIVGIIIVLNGIDFDSLDKEPTKVFVFIIAPEKKRNHHIRFLSAISGILKQEQAVNEMLSEKTPTAVLESFLRYSLPSATNKKESKEFNLLHIYCQLEEKFDEIMGIITEVSECDISVIEGNNAGKYIHAMPLFAKFWGDESQGFQRIITTVLPKTNTNDILRKINNIIDKLPERTGVMVYMQTIDYINGNLNV
ncbi:MAG: PTS sugar transporter subunit IIA [Candidatus Delongbacteria bacterium]|nr:PTS sugar transporter subunit IIA [Candidatus Delongbacteria bacterium]